MPATLRRPAPLADVTHRRSPPDRARFVAPNGVPCLNLTLGPGKSDTRWQVSWLTVQTRRCPGLPGEIFASGRPEQLPKAACIALTVHSCRDSRGFGPEARFRPAPHSRFKPPYGSTGAIIVTGRQAARTRALIAARRAEAMGRTAPSFETASGQRLPQACYRIGEQRILLRLPIFFSPIPSRQPPQRYQFLRKRASYAMLGVRIVQKGPHKRQRRRPG